MTDAEIQAYNDRFFKYETIEFDYGDGAALRIPGQ
jgi:hypothetical protein